MQMYVTVLHFHETASPPMTVQIQSSGLTVMCTEAESSRTGRCSADSAGILWVKQQKLSQVEEDSEEGCVYPMH